MNDQLQAFARKMLIDGLNKLPSENQRIFKLMYGRDNGNRSVSDSESLVIETVVTEMPEEKLDWAMQQVQRTLDKAKIK
jgi:hypothetical protein